MTHGAFKCLLSICPHHIHICLFCDSCYCFKIEKRSQYLLQHSHNICCDLLWHAMTMLVKRPQQPHNISGTKEMLWRCWDKVEMNSNSSQHLTTLSRGVVKRSQHRLTTNVVRMLWQMLWPFDRAFTVTVWHILCLWAHPKVIMYRAKQGTERFFQTFCGCIISFWHP